MSDVSQNPTENNDQNVSTESGLVKKEAYVAVSKDMHTYKAKLKETQAQLEAIKADQEAKEMASLRENEKWKDLFAKTEEKLKKIQSERDSERNKFVETHKKNAIVTELGGFKKPEYAKFVDVSKVEIDENGNLDVNSIAAEVQRIKKEFPELIKMSSSQPLPNAAPKGFAEKDYNSMSASEKIEYKRTLLNKK